ncbi:hypothetical protein QCE63_29510 [Caballeronia sp. LZ065]|uniref:hypothetical protein n=1 Tax=Caballeronia sp. LZ065 TaxID=3038571 RepID=UPI0028592BC6|nr:hypothetical protein [Caballeronia sp. LZ065]MDR5783555.1 hypothetical protein [Caballeronia sp. LZ065]
MAPHWEKPVPREVFGEAARQTLASGIRLDPYLVWATLGRRENPAGGSGGRMPIALELKRGGVTARQLAHEIDRHGWQDWIWMSALYRDPPDRLESTRFCTAHVTREFFTRLGTDLSGKIERLTGMVTLPPAHGVRPHGRAALSPVPACAFPARMIVGVCEEELSFFHRRHAQHSFGTDTRFHCFWNQNDAMNSARGLGYGGELLKNRMNALLSDASPASSQALAHRPGLPAGPEERPPMIGVQLRHVTRDRTLRGGVGPSPDASLLDAVRYVAQRAHDIGGPRSHPLVSMNAGDVAWQQDGSSLIEGALDELMDIGACSIILPSGTDNWAPCRDTRTIITQAVLQWPVPAGCATPGFAEIWLDGAGAEPDIDIQVVTPGGVGSAWLARGEIGVCMQGADRLCSVVHLGRGARGARPMILVAVQPTAHRAPPGRWIIRLRNNARTAVTAFAWMSGDEAPEDLPLAAPVHSRDGGD